MNSTRNNRYVPGLDGLRALAIFFIAAYHFSFSWADGGFLGVDIFFVLSGYLVTSKILKSQEDELDFDFKKFWSGRIRRLLPVFYVVIITVVIWVVLFNRELLNIIWGDSASSVFYSTNWWFIFHKLSYFDSFGAPSPLKHLWYMAVQEQFLLVWSIVLIKGAGYLKKRRNFIIIVLGGALCSALLMGILYNPEMDPSRIYYGTDTRSFEPLIGGLLAIILPIDKLHSKEISVKQSIALNFVGIISLAVFIGSCVFVSEYQDFLYRGGLVLFDLNTVLLIVCLCIPACFIGKIFSWKPLRWIGTRSYGIYLWHYPIMVLSTPVYEIGSPVYWRVGLQIIVTCIAAELSYRFIEKPVRQLGIRGFYRRYLSINSLRWRRLTMVKRLFAVTAGLMVLAAVIAGTVAANYQEEGQKAVSSSTGAFGSSTLQSASDNASGAVSPENDAVNPEAGDDVSGEVNVAASSAQNNASSTIEDRVESSAGNAIAGTEKKDGESSIENNTSSTTENSEESSAESDIKSSGKNDEAGSNENNTAVPGEKSGDNSPVVDKGYKEVLAIGDSIMLDIAPYLKKKCSNITIDGKVSRQLADGAKLASSYKKFNDAEMAVVIELGTNGYFSDKQIDSLLDSFSKAHVYLVNTRVPRRWEKTVNEKLKEKTEERENVVLIDWYSTAVSHPEYFGSDAVHLKVSGSEALTNLICEALDPRE